MVNKCLSLKKNRVRFKEKIYEYCNKIKVIDENKINFEDNEDDNDIIILLYASDYVYGSFDVACYNLRIYIEDELNIVCDEMFMDCNEAYKIVIFYDEISNETEEIIGEFLDILDKYNYIFNRKIDIQYDNNSCYISWY